MGKLKNPSAVAFLHRWANGPIPHHVLSAGAEIMEMEEYTPEQRVHQIVQKSMILMLEYDARAVLGGQGND